MRKHANNHKNKGDKDLTRFGNVPMFSGEMNCGFLIQRIKNIIRVTNTMHIYNPPIQFTNLQCTVHVPYLVYEPYLTQCMSCFNLTRQDGKILLGKL